MRKEIKQRRIFGMDIHPSCFTAASFIESDRYSSNGDFEPKSVQDKIPMEQFDLWLEKHTNPGDILVMESLSLSFNLVQRIEKSGRKGVVLESCEVGSISKSYLKNDKVDAVKIGRIYLSNFRKKIVWVPDERTIERREILMSYRNAVKDSTRSLTRIWSYLSQNGIVVNQSIKRSYKKNPHSLFKLKEWTMNQNTILETYIIDYQNANNKRTILERLMAEEAVSDSSMIKLQQFIGIRHISAYALMAVIGDINRFANPKKLVAYIGLQPCVKDSGDSTYSGSISRGGKKYLKSILMECSKSIIQFAPLDHSLAKWARKLMYRKKANVVTTAVARKLITAIWYVLKGYSSPLTELSQMIEIKLRKIAIKVGKERRRELGYSTLEGFVQAKGQFLISSA